MTDRGDVSDTLGELERKLKELEKELSAAGRRPDVASAPAPAPAPAAPSAATVPTPPSPAEASPSPAQSAAVVSNARAQLSAMQAQLDELDAYRAQLQESARALMGEYERVLSGTAQPLHAVPPPITPPPVAQPIAPPPAPAQPPAAMLSGEIVIDAGPFSDIGALSRFEQALAHIPGTDDVYVRGFEGDRALIDVLLSEPLDLAVALQRVSPIPAHITHTDGRRVTVTVNHE